MDVLHGHMGRKKTQKYLREGSTTTLNALQPLFWPHLYGEDL